MAKKVKSKGNNFERLICKKLSLWYSENKRDDIFWRTSGSGSRATQRMKNESLTINSCGDVCALDETGAKFINNYLIELKCGYGHKIKKGKTPNGKSSCSISTGLSLADIVERMARDKAKKPLIIEWLDKAKKEARNNNIKEVIIIFKRDRKDICIVLSKTTFDMLELNHQKKWMYPNDGPSITAHFNSHTFKVLKLNDFLYWCNPKAFFRRISTLNKTGIKRRNKKPWKKGKYGSIEMKKKKEGLKTIPRRKKEACPKIKRRNK